VKTQLLEVEPAAAREIAVSTAVDYLRRGEAIALPTETVYGLAADALNVDAALRIFEAKERPRFDPLIVHLPTLDWLERLAIIPAEDEELVRRLTSEFWPGALTLVLPRHSIVPDVVTAGLETVALRMSAHPVFREIIQAFGGPLAAPSANRFGRISPTDARHVAAELDGRILLIIDGGATTHGLESTIVSVRHGKIRILRPGPITVEELSELAEVKLASPAAKLEAPGQFRSHYAPRTRLVLVDDLEAFAPAAERVGCLSFLGTRNASFVEKRTLSASGNLREAAANLFRCLRELDDAQLDLIAAQKIPESGLGSAIMDRLKRAAAR